MKWKHRTIKEVSGFSLSGNLIQVARAVNHNAYLLKEAVQKIEELSAEVEKLKTELELHDAEIQTKTIDEFAKEIRDWQIDIQDNEHDAAKFDFVFERIYEIAEEMRGAE